MILHKVKRLGNKIRYGLVLQFLLSQLEARMRITITPYYMTLEGLDENMGQLLDGNLSDYSFSFFGLDEIRQISREEPSWYQEEEMVKRLELGKKCFGAKCRSEIVAFAWIDLDECNYQPARFSMKPNEAYLYDHFTMKAYRGKNIAPYVRLRIYRALRNMGRDTFYSITECLNPPAIKFKKKLNARFLSLCMYVELFRRFRWNWVLRDWSGHPSCVKGHSRDASQR